MLRSCLPFLKYDSSGKYFPLAILLQAVVNRPESFEYSPANKSPLFKEWHKKTLDTAYRFIYRESFSPKAQKTTLVPQQEIAEAKKAAAEQHIEIKPQFRFFHEAYAELKDERISASQGTEKFFTSFQGKENEAAALEMSKWVGVHKQEAEKTDPKKNEWSRLEKDFKAYFNQPQLLTYELADANALQGLQDHLQNSIEQEQIGLNELLQKGILVLANRKPIFEIEKGMRKLEKWGKQRKVVTLEDLIIHFGRQDAAAFCAVNPAWDDMADGLIAVVREYLLKATKLQQLERANKKVDDENKLLKKTSKRFHQLEMELGEILAGSQRAYDPDRRPALLVFEYLLIFFYFQSRLKSLRLFSIEAMSIPSWK